MIEALQEWAKGTDAGIMQLAEKYGELEERVRRLEMAQQGNWYDQLEILSTNGFLPSLRVTGFNTCRLKSVPVVVVSPFGSGVTAYLVNGNSEEIISSWSQTYYPSGRPQTCILAKGKMYFIRDVSGTGIQLCSLDPDLETITVLGTLHTPVGNTYQVGIDWDGDDTLYIAGGQFASTSIKVFKYVISTGTLSTLLTFSTGSNHNFWGMGYDPVDERIYFSYETSSNYLRYVAASGGSSVQVASSSDEIVAGFKGMHIQNTVGGGTLYLKDRSKGWSMDYNAQVLILEDESYPIKALQISPSSKMMELNENETVTPRGSLGSAYGVFSFSSVLSSPCLMSSFSRRAINFRLPFSFRQYNVTATQLLVNIGVEGAFEIT